MQNHKAKQNNKTTTKTILPSKLILYCKLMRAPLSVKFTVFVKERKRKTSEHVKGCEQGEQEQEQGQEQQEQMDGTKYILRNDHSPGGV
jgi:hypothetical protein